MYSNLGIPILPEQESDKDERIISINVEKGELNILLKNDGDHPTLLTINLYKDTYTTKGYD